MPALTIEQWRQYRAAGWTDEVLAANGYTIAQASPPPAPPAPPTAAPAPAAYEWDNTTGDDAGFRRPKLTAGDWRNCIVLEVEGPTKTAYGPAIFVIVRAADGIEYSVKHQLGTAARDETAKRSLGCLIAACGVANLGAIRNGCSTPIRIAASDQISKDTGKAYVRCDYLSMGGAAQAPAPMPPAPGNLPPMPPALPPPSTPGGSAYPAPPPPPPATDGRPAGWMGAWPPA